MASNILDILKKCPLENIGKEVSSIPLSELTFFELANIEGKIFNELYYQLKPLKEEMEKKYLEMKEQEQNLNFKPLPSH